VRSGVALVLLLVAACGHGEPWAFTETALRVPLVEGTVTRLTYGTSDDLDPAWFPDGVSFVYSTERIDREDRDRCLAVMSASGGTVTAYLCQRAGPSDDTLDVLQVPSPAADGRLAFLYSTYELIRFTGYRTRDLVVAAPEDPFAPEARKAILPLRPNGGFTHDGIAEIAWRSPTQLVYLATLPHYPLPCKTCRPDTATPVQLVTADIGGDTAVATAVPNTLYATSFALAAPDTVYYTLLGEGRILRRDLATGAETLVRDFGTGAIARDVQVRGSRLLVIVGGGVTVELLPGMGWVQHDDGGPIHLLDLDTGTETVVGGGGRGFRRAALSPDGRTVLAESREAPGDDWDIWRVSLP
jgi:hypothetical protein